MGVYIHRPSTSTRRCDALQCFVEYHFASQRRGCIFPVCLRIAMKSGRRGAPFPTNACIVYTRTEPPLLAENRAYFVSDPPNFLSRTPLPTHARAWRTLLALFGESDLRRGEGGKEASLHHRISDLAVSAYSDQMQCLEYQMPPKRSKTYILEGLFIIASWPTQWFFFLVLTEFLRFFFLVLREGKGEGGVQKTSTNLLGWTLSHLS